MKYSSLVKRIAGESAEVWDIHEEGRKRLAQGEDVIMLSIGEESDQTTPASIQQEAVDSIRRGRHHYTPVIGEDHLRKAIAMSHPLIRNDTCPWNLRARPFPWKIWVILRKRSRTRRQPLVFQNLSGSFPRKVRRL